MHNHATTGPVIETVQATEPTNPELSAQWLDQRIRYLFESPDYQPPVLPRVALDLMEMTRDADMSIGKMVTVLEQDPVLTGRVLRLVRSSYYAGQVPIRSLHHAVVRLGLATLRDAVMEVAFQTNVFRAGAWRPVMMQLQAHSRATAYIAKICCKYTGVDDEYAFLCGLLHDVGFAGLMIAVAEDDRLTEEMCISTAWPALNRVHEAAGGLMARIWGLPPEIRYVLANHHQVRVGRQPDPMIATVQIAEQIAAGLGFGMTGPQMPDGTVISLKGEHVSQLTLARAVLSIDKPKWSAIIEDARATMAGLS